MNINPDPVHRLDGAPNFRDLGGYATRSGGRVRHGRLFRSQSLAALTDTDTERLQQIGIRLICDLRSDGERMRAPNRLPRQYSGERLEIGIDIDLQAKENPYLAAVATDPTPASARQAMHGIYSRLPDAFSTLWPHLIGALLERRQLPALIHCSVGKDRTGFACAMLLLAVDVPREEVYRDYLRTAEHYPAGPAARHLLATSSATNIQTLPLEAMLPFFAVEPDYLDAAFTSIEHHHGSVENYLQNVAGLDRAQRRRLRELLVEE